MLVITRKKIKLWSLKAILFMSVSTGATMANSECVVLLHGLMRTESSMVDMAKALSQAGYTAVNVSYASREDNILALTESTIPPSIARCPKGETVNFVTHSLGGILVRQYLSLHNVENMGRVVMLGPPNQGSEVVDKLGAFPGFKFLNGEAGLQLGTGQLSVPKRLGPATFDVGVIAGTRSINIILSRMIPGVDDGKVSVEATRLEGMSEHLVLPVTHTFMMKDKTVIAQVLHYLKFGAFN